MRVITLATKFFPWPRLCISANEFFCNVLYLNGKSCTLAKHLTEQKLPGAFQKSICIKFRN